MAVRKILLCQILLKTSPTAPRIFFFYGLSFGYNKRHSCRRFSHVKVFFYAKKNRGAIFFGVDRPGRPIKTGRIAEGGNRAIASRIAEGGSPATASRIAASLYQDVGHSAIEIMVGRA